MKISQISIFKLPKKHLNAYQQIMLLENLTSLLSNGFTLLECFN
ncbi:competence protein ComGB, partial [Staphylococcus devriesei]